MGTATLKKMETVTVEKMKDIGDCYAAIEWAQKQRAEYPETPKKPSLPNKHTSIEAKQYSIHLETYERLREDYDGELAVWKADENAINEIIVEFIKGEADIDSVPEQYRAKLYSKAWEGGHSSGYVSVYQELCSLVEIFKYYTRMFWYTEN